MKLEIIVGILFMLLAKRRVTAVEIAERFCICRRSVYRYLDTLSTVAPIAVTRGVNGGYSIADSFKLPSTFLTEGEYEAVIRALSSLTREVPSGELTWVLEKLKAARKVGREVNLTGGNIVIDSGPWGVTAEYNNKLKVLADCVERSRPALITYRDNGGVVSERLVEPHVVVLKLGVWYVYAFCRLRNDFRLFKVGRVENIFVKEETFERRGTDGLSSSLTYTSSFGNEEVELSFGDDARAEIEEWLGVECVSGEDGCFVARAHLPVNSGLVGKILSFGGRVRVNKPQSVKDAIIKVCRGVLERA